MSSNGFATELTPGRLPRKCLLCLSAAATLFGFVLVLGLPVRPAVKALFAMLWICSGLLEIRSEIRGMSRIERIRIDHAGVLTGLAADGAVWPVRPLGGSVVLTRVAWLRLGFADGLRYGELLMGDPRSSEQWRHLQLIWRQYGCVFGRPRGS